MNLLLIRHAQASYGAANYDELSPLGWRQAEALGHWLAQQPEFGAVRVGTLKRHRQTLQAINEACVIAGRILPTATTDPGLDEFDHAAVIRAFLEQHADTTMRERAASKSPAVVGPMLHAAISAWSEDRLAGVPESWSEFGERIAAAGARAADDSRQGAVLVVSSGGVISRLAQQALEVPAARAVDLNLAIRNTALNEFALRQERLRFGSFNTLPHLAHDRSLWTHF